MRLHGFQAVNRCLAAFSGEEIIDQIKASGLRGRGGAGFPTGQKWELAANSRDSDKIVICNADEGEPGTFKDRILLNTYADKVFEGMTVCAGIIGACVLARLLYPIYPIGRANIAVDVPTNEGVLS